MFKDKRMKNLPETLRQKQLIIFDFDGTILDSMSMWEHLGTEYILSKGIEPPSGLDDEIFSRTLEETGEYCIKEVGLKKTLEEFLTDIYGFICPKYNGELPLKPGAKSFVKKVSASGKASVVLTTTGRPCVEASVTHHGLEDVFTEIYTAGEIKMSKSTPEIYRFVMDEMGYSPEETIVFEDAPYAVKSAKQAGCTVVSVYDRTAEAGKHVIREYSDFHIKDFEELLSYMDHGME